jgi:hypothetical protein
MYTPDGWVIVYISDGIDGNYTHRVFASWYGGYLNGDSWRMSSGIVKITDNGDHWSIDNHSGSVYNCAKNKNKLSSYTQSILYSYQKQAEEKDMVFEVVDIETIKEHYA